jgi:hypothetical protein
MQGKIAGARLLRLGACSAVVLIACSVPFYLAHAQDPEAGASAATEREQAKLVAAIEGLSGRVERAKGPDGTPVVPRPKTPTWLSWLAFPA